MRTLPKTKVGVSNFTRGAYKVYRDSRAGNSTHALFICGFSHRLKSYTKTTKGAYMSKATILAVCVAFITLIGFISTLSVWNYTQGKEIAKLKAELANASTLLQAQNAQILQDKLDLEAYQKSAQEVRERVVTRYVNTSTQDKACEAQLSAIQKALETFYTRGR